MPRILFTDAPLDPSSLSRINVADGITAILKVISSIIGLTLFTIVVIGFLVLGFFFLKKLKHEYDSEQIDILNKKLEFIKREKAHKLIMQKMDEERIERLEGKKSAAYYQEEINKVNRERHAENTKNQTNDKS